MKKVFLDTGFLIAFSNKKDKYHEIALKMLEDKNSKQIILLTNEYVMIEFLGYIERRINYSTAVRLWDKFRKDNMFLYQVIDENLVELAWSRYRKQQTDSKPFSFVDCIIIETCIRENINEILTFDKKLQNYKIK